MEDDETVVPLIVHSSSHPSAASSSAPLQIVLPYRTLVDLEVGPGEQPQCRICLESDGRDFIAPCKCKGSAKYVHRECLDHWRSVKEGFAFAHCTTCKARYHLRVQVPADQKWRALKFRFFVTRDILCIFLIVQLVIISLSYSMYCIDHYEKDWLRLLWGFQSSIHFYYICGALLFFALLGLSGCVITCYDRRVRNDLAQPCRELCLCCCHSGVLVATMVGQRIWQRHYHILAKRMLTKDYVVEDLDGQPLGLDWAPPPLPPEHVQQLKSLGLL